MPTPAKNLVAQFHNGSGPHLKKLREIAKKAADIPLIITHVGKITEQAASAGKSRDIYALWKTVDDAIFWITNEPIPGAYGAQSQLFKALSQFQRFMDDITARPRDPLCVAFAQATEPEMRNILTRIRRTAPYARAKTPAAEARRDACHIAGTVVAVLHNAHADPKVISRLPRALKFYAGRLNQISDTPTARYFEEQIAAISRKTVGIKPPSA
ncbi:MAG: hypothetical protein H6865_08010 [Rhodospirillales bacterium]|nr:hypothetical protein [Alphaproteobacteria bacterium]MCB9987560.1 hypothetical protein [Rhodospirillales bacterium]USO07719.1 MAG: hypothetical protein H6866_00340 [Rhodospirillales bacterium]